MSVVTPLERTRTTTTGLSIEKAVVQGEGGVVEVWFNLRSSVDGRLSFRLVEDLPATVDPGDVGFHPEYGRDNWMVAPGEVTFTKTLSPEAELRTVYAVRGVEDVESVAADLGSNPTVDAIRMIEEGYGADFGHSRD